MSYYSFKDGLKLALNRKKLLLISILIGLAAGIVLAFALPEYYRSSALLYSYNLHLFDPGVKQFDEPEDVLGTLEENERLIALARSAGVQNMLISKFSLTQHYNIDTTQKYFKTAVSEEFRKNFQVLKDERGGVKILVTDKDPNLAAAILNESIQIIDVLNGHPLNERVESNLHAINEKKIKLEGNFGLANSIRKEDLDFQLKNLEVFRDKTFSTLFIIDKPEVADKPYYPNRFLLILGLSLIAPLIVWLGLILGDITGKRVSA